MNITELPSWTLQERLAKAREFARLDRHQMAERLGVTERTIRNWEHGRIEPTRATVLAYSAVTNVPVLWLEGNVGDTSANTQRYSRDEIMIQAARAA